MADNKEKRVKLDLVHKSQEYIKIVQNECGVRTYDSKKVRERLNCNNSQANTLISLTQIADAQQAAGTGKAAKA